MSRWTTSLVTGPGVMLAAAIVAASVIAQAGVDAGGPAMSVGIGGAYRIGEWTPVVVRSPTPIGGAVRVAVEDPDGQFVASPPVPVASDGTTVTASVRPGRPQLRIRVVPAEDGDDTILASLDARSGQPGLSTTPLMLVIGDLPAATSAARLVAGDEKAIRVVTVAGPDAAAATSPRDFDAFDAMIVCGTAITTIAPATFDHLDGWVRRGGRLVFAAGASALPLASAGGVPASWLPGAEPRLVPLRRASAIEAFARSGGLSSRIPATGIMVPRFESPIGVIDVFEGSTATDLPLAVRRAHGFGTITWIGLDLEEGWCSKWPGCDRLLAALLGGRHEADQTPLAATDASRRVPDLAGQLRIAIDTFGADGGRAPSRPVPFEIIATIGIVYCLVLLPLDWWFVRRTGRPWMSWLSLPVVAVGFSAVAWQVGAAWGRDAPPRARAAEIIDLDETSGLARGSAWAAVRTPVNGALDIDVAATGRAAVADHHAMVTWFADRGAGFGGVDASIAHPSLAAADYAYRRDLSSLAGVPIAAASSRLFEAGWTGTFHEPVAESTLARDARGLLTGRVTSRLSFAIERCWLLHGGWLYDAGRMAPDTPYDTEAGRGPRSLAAALTRRTAMGDRDCAERWDAASTDIDRILEIAGFHASAGTVYTGLAPGRLGRLDLSPLLAADRAILVGIVKGEPLTDWRIRLHGSGSAETVPVERAGETVIRIVVPVGTAAAVEEASK